MQYEKHIKLVCSDQKDVRKTLDENLEPAVNNCGDFDNFNDMQMTFEYG